MPFLPDILPCIVGGIFWRKEPRVPCPSRRSSVRPARSHSLPVERLLPGPLQCPLLPSVSLFRRFRCYPDRPPAPHGSLRHPPPPGVSRFRRIGSHLRRVAGAWPGAMAAGAREQAASCDAFVLSRRLPAPDAPPSRTSPAGLIAKAPSNPRRTTACCLGRDCRSEFRQARSRTPEPDGVLAVVGMTDGVWQGGSVMSTPRRGPCRTSRHDRG